MSTLIVEVCEVASVERHPHADRLGIATVKGWKTAIGFDPATGEYEFRPGEHCVYFPPDSVLPPALANSPYRVCKTKGCKALNKTSAQLPPDQRAVDGRCAICGNPVEWKDGTPGRTGAMAFCGELPPDADGVRPPGGRVRAARLRGLQSFGFIMKIDPAQGDDPNWAVGADLRAHFGVTKWEPPIENVDGEVDAAHPAFHHYTDIEHLANFPGVIADGDEVVITEKLHGKNCRVGLILETGENGEPARWTWMAGSHGQRRKEFAASIRRFDLSKLVDRFVLPAGGASAGHVFPDEGGRFWRVVNNERAGPADLWAEEVVRADDGSCSPRVRRSEFWEPLTDEVRAMLTHVRDTFNGPFDSAQDGTEPVRGVVCFGELYGTLDMKYGLKNARGFRAFDLAVNGTYLSHHEKAGLCARFGIETVPLLYRGPFDAKVVADLTDGPTSMCDPKEAGPFAGREGIVITPAVERIDDRMMPTSTHGRVIFKSVSADYLARKGGTDAH